MPTHSPIHGELARRGEVELAAIVRAAAQDNAQAWKSLVTHFTPTLRGVVRGYRLSSTDVEDVVEASWAAAFAHIDRLRAPSAFGSWLAVIGRREAIRTAQGHRRGIPVDESYFPIGLHCPPRCENVNASTPF